jgi:hypothetical protein
MNSPSLTVLTCLVAGLLTLGCGSSSDDEPIGTSPASELSFEGRFELGVGDRTLTLPLCVARQTVHPTSLQIVGSDEKGNRFYGELEAGARGVQTNKKHAPSLVVLTLDTPVEKDEDPIYSDKDLRITILEITGESIKGTIHGRVADLLRKRPHELRGRFECPIDKP